MSKSIKSLFVGALLVVMAVGVMPSGAAAQTSQDQINSLLAMIAQLQAQIAALQGGTVGTGTGMTLTCNFTANLTVGSTGNQVKALQQFLNAKGFTVSASGAGSAGNETSYFGPATKAAVARFQVANSITPAVGYFGPITRTKVNSMCTVVVPPPGGGTTPPPAGSNLTVSLASDNPAAMAVPKGAAGVTFLKVTVMGTGTVDSLTFKRVGIGATADFAASGIYLYDGNTRLTTGRSLNSTTHEVTFLNLGIAVSGTKTLSVVADVSSTATTGNRNAFQLVGATGTPSVTLTTLTGNEMTIAGQSVGAVTVTSGAAPTNPKVGQVGAKLAEIKIAADSTEDVELRRLSLTEGGSISNSNLMNFVLKQAGNTVATASAIGARDLVTFNFTSAFLLEKGQERTFEVYGDVSGGTRANDTIVFYVDSKSDVYAVGRTYGFPVNPDITALDVTTEGNTLTVQGGDVTITFNGPIASDIAKRGQDVVLYDFTIASQNNIEIRNLRMSATTTNLGSGEGFNDFKVWDASTNSVITSATDVTTSTAITFTDVININAGQSKRFKVTADVDADDDDSDTIQVHLLAFQSNDIRNLDNNTYVSTSSIVPASNIAGNTMTVKVPTLDVQLSSTPSSQTYAEGTANVPLAGFSFRAIADNVRLDTVKITGSATSGTLTSGEVTNLGLYKADGTLVSSLKSLDSSALTATFDSLNFTIAKGETVVLTLKGNVSTDATNGDVYAFKIGTLATDVVAYDSQSNSATLSGISANSTGAVLISVVSSGDVSVVVAGSDTEVDAGIVVAGREETLGKFRFTATNEAMTINKLQILVTTSSSATATSTEAADEAPLVKLYNGSTQVGATSGYSVNASGDNAGIAVVENLGLSIPKDGSVTLTVKAVLNSIAQGADSGASLYASIMAANFESQGSSAKDTTITAATGNQKVVYKTRPTITSAQGDTTLTNGLRKVMSFTVAADSAEQVAWKKVQVAVTMTSATMSAATGGTTGTVQIRDSTGTSLNLGTVYSGNAVASATATTITGGTAGYVSMILASEQVVAAGTSKTYDVYLTFADVPSTSASAVVTLNRAETTVVGGSSASTVESTSDGTPSFIWSDYSAVAHTESTSDWANGVFVKTLPSTSYTISKT